MESFWPGLVLMIVSEAATLAHVEPFWSWNTPIAWTGFILFADAIVWRARGNSWIRSAPWEFAWLAIASIPLWLVFEFYNRFIENWHYVGLPENPVLRYFGYAWAFATIWPAIFEGAELIAVWREWRGARKPRAALGVSSAAAAPGTPFGATPDGHHGLLTTTSIAIGAAMLIWPLVWPSPYLAAPVWLGFIFLLEPINVRLGGESLARDVHHGSRLKNLMLSGFLCGLLWEFWNYWSRTKWQYTVPIMEKLKIFEMPLPGYLGFPAFALECFTMYVFVRTIAAHLTRTTTRLSRTIAL